jgi:uncharacterized protein YebE (UPF0316 family)
MLDVSTAQLAIIIFFLRLIDTTISAVRILYLVDGKILITMLLALVEVSLWAFTTANLIYRVKDSPLLIFAFAGGVSAGNGIGIYIKEKLK